jgi:aldose 1-epimerase
MELTQQPFGKTIDGKPVTLYVCKNATGCVLKMIDYGAIITAVEVPDRQGRIANVTLGFPTLDGYLQRHPYFGATVGRYGNRIGGGRFQLDGKTFKLATNDGENHLHGGERGFDRWLWHAEPIRTASSVGVKFSRTSTDGEEGYPGNIQAAVTYTLNRDNELKMEYTATTDAPCPVNLTNHCYWNLAGAGSGTILDQDVMIAADQYVAVDDQLIPTGALPAVQGTPLDFTQATKIGARIAQVQGDPGGYDHCYVLRSKDGSLALAARVHDPQSGRVMEVLTTQPGIQFYSGNFLDGTAANGGYPQHAGFCLETQHFPDSPNHPNFPNTILRPGETYHHVTVHRFRVE